MPNRTSKNRTMAQGLLKSLDEVKPSERNRTVSVAMVYAVLELAFQVGRVADSVPVYGPPED